jgi:hypothetical protein
MAVMQVHRRNDTVYRIPIQFNEHKNLNMYLTDIKSLRIKQSNFKI